MTSLAAIYRKCTVYLLQNLLSPSYSLSYGSTRSSLNDDTSILSEKTHAVENPTTQRSLLTSTTSNDAP
jgi:hypothetical protein